MARRYVNKVILIGDVVDTPRVVTHADGRRAAYFILETTRTWRKSDGEVRSRTERHPCAAWNAGPSGYPLADVVEEWVRANSQVYVEGRLEYYSRSGDPEVNAIVLMLSDVHVLGASSAA